MRKSHKDLEAQLALLEELDDRAGLLALWAQQYEGVQPPRNISNGLLRRAIAYRLQEQTFGGLKPATRLYLESVISGDDKPATKPPVETKASPGTRLVREWHGRVYEVLVLPKGVQMNGQTYRSLSDVARVITGVHWSGPRFFGLTSVPPVSSAVAE